MISSFRDFVQTHTHRETLPKTISARDIAGAQVKKLSLLKLKPHCCTLAHKLQSN